MKNYFTLKKNLREHAQIYILFYKRNDPGQAKVLFGHLFVKNLPKEIIKIEKKEH